METKLEAALANAEKVIGKPLVERLSALRALQAVTKKLRRGSLVHNPELAARVNAVVKNLLGD